MTPRPTYQVEDAASALGRLLHDSGKRSAESAGSELERLLRAASDDPTNRARAPRRGAWAVCAAAVAVVALTGSIAWYRHTNAVLTFSTNGVPGRDGAAIAAGSARAVDLAFSDGSVFNIEPSTRIRVDSSAATGARLTLVDGKAVAHVVHRSKSSWSVSAGPFQVRVTGTRFGASWDPHDERLTVELYEGSVQIVGGGFAAPISVVAGQRLEAGKGQGNWLLTSLEGPGSAIVRAKPGEANAVAPASLPEPSANAQTGSPSMTRATSPQFDWPALLGRADFDGIVRQASDFGIERCFSGCAPADLRMLADSARYLGRFELAERSLLALRRRSPGDAANAAFLLGRLEESRDPREAMAWYEKNLEEAPGGAYAAEALGGKMRLLLQEGGPRAAAAAAERYLSRFPKGVHAAKARDVILRARTRIDR